MPRVKTMKKFDPPLMMVENTSRSVGKKGMIYSDDEKTTVSRYGAVKPKSAMRDPKSRRATRPKRRLKFDQYDEVFEIPHIKDLSQEEIEAVWMGSDDFTSIRQECLGTVSSIGNDKVSDGFLLRGLDQHTNRYKETRDFIGRQLYDAVLSVQEFERTNGVDCSELMGRLSRKYSEPSVVAAQSAALSDLFSSFKGTWSQRSIPTIPDGALKSGTWETQC